jgi:opacity protein-like surface antigen
VKPIFAVLVLCVAVPASAQTTGSRWYNAPADVPQITFRPFLDVSTQAFTAAKSFDAVFGDRTAPFWGGGLQVVVWRGRVYTELGASRLLKKNGELVGERAFVNEGVAHRLGIPLRSTIKSLEFVAGYRFNVSPRIIPYAGAGLGNYHYTEESNFADSSENLDVEHLGSIFQAGAEFRAHRWIGVAGDAHYTHIPGILGVGGVSQQFAADTQNNSDAAREKDLGGWAVRLKVVVGR